jgi:hypothetical protein
MSAATFPVSAEREVATERTNPRRNPDGSRLRTQRREHR